MDKTQLHEFSIALPGYDLVTGTTVHYKNTVQSIILETPVFRLTYITTFVFRLPLTVAQAETFTKWHWYMDINGKVPSYNFILTSEIVETL